MGVEVRRYRMGDGRLVETAIRMLVVADRDVDLLDPLGWGQTRLDSLHGTMMAFTDLPNDAELLAMKAERTAVKVALRKTAIDHVMRQMMTRVAQRFGSLSHTYRLFRTAGIHNMPDTELYLALIRVARMATSRLSQLAEVGMQQSHIDTTLLHAAALLAAMVVQDTAIDDRDHGLEERMTTANALYDELVALSATGRGLWAGKSAAHHKGYVIQPRSSAATAKAA